MVKSLSECYLTPSNRSAPAHRITGLTELLHPLKKHTNGDTTHFHMQPHFPLHFVGGLIDGPLSVFGHAVRGDTRTPMAQRVPFLDVNFMYRLRQAQRSGCQEWMTGKASEPL